MNLNETTAEGSDHRNGTGCRAHVIVWALLLLLTLLSVTLAELSTGTFGIVATLGIAAIQAVLVLLYFMHLRHEKRLAIRLLLPITIVTLTVFIGLTFVDVVSR